MLRLRRKPIIIKTKKGIYRIEHQKKWILGGALAIVIAMGLVAPVKALPPASLSGSQVAIATDGSYSWDYTTDLYNGTSGALLEWNPAHDFADMNATEWLESDEDHQFTHTFAGNLSDWYAEEGNADQTIQSYWFYFPAGYEEDTANITIILHWGVAGTGFNTYV